MKPEVKNWWAQANKDLEVAKRLFNDKEYDYCSFWCQQAAEKALKALLLEKTSKLIKTHDLLFLARKLELPKKLIENCKNLSPVYVETRYPDANGKFGTYTREESDEDLKLAEEILSWVIKNLS